MAHGGIYGLKALQILRKKTTAEYEREQFKLLRPFHEIMKNWKGKLPNLREIFRSEEIDLLLSDSIKYFGKESELIIKFVTCTGYKDEAGGEQRSLRTTPVHHAASCRDFSNESMRDLFRIYDRFEVNYTNEQGITHFHVACKYDCGEAVEKFLENGQDPDILWPKTGDPLLHLAVKWGHQDIFRLLLKYGADPNKIDERKFTPLHTIANTFVCDEKLMFLKIFFEICAEKHHKVLINAQKDFWGHTPLHIAMFHGCKMVVELLLRNGANPNLVDSDGRTPLHHMCKFKVFEDMVITTLQTFFDVCDEIHWSVKVDTLDKDRETPLHSSLKHNNKKMAELLLRRGADPSLVDKHGYTPLHSVVCYSLHTPSIIRYTQDNVDNAFVKTFFKMCDEVDRVLQVDVRNKSGETPLQIALNGGNKEIAELLLRRGANPNLPDEDGMTYLHNFSRSRTMLSELRTFFEIDDKNHKTVQVDARDKRGRTPLQLAVANLLPDVVDLLLDRGADLSSFVFPSESDFDENFKLVYSRSKMELAVDALSSVKNLERRGYELYRSDALAIMKLFAKFELFEKPKELQCLLDDEELASKAKEIMINPNISFLDLIQLQPEVANILTPTDLYKFMQTGYWKLPCELIKAFSRFDSHLCEKMSRGFFCAWALESFLELTHIRLPILCCEKILENLNNEDLYNICLAAENRCERKRPKDVTP